MSTCAGPSPTPASRCKFPSPWLPPSPPVHPIPFSSVKKSNEICSVNQLACIYISCISTSAAPCSWQLPLERHWSLGAGLGAGCEVQLRAESTATQALLLPAPWAWASPAITRLRDGGNLSSHFCIFVLAKRVRSRTLPDEDPRQAKPEKLVYVYSNSKMAAAFSDTDKLKMFALDNKDVQPLSLALRSARLRY
jgi:hypothetical protein